MTVNSVTINGLVIEAGFSLIKLEVAGADHPFSIDVITTEKYVSYLKPVSGDRMCVMGTLCADGEKSLYIKAQQIMKVSAF